MKVPPDLDPRVIHQYGPPTRDGVRVEEDAEFDMLTNAITNMHDSASRIVQYHESAKDDTTITRDAAAERVRSFAQDAAKRTTRSLDTALQRASTVLAQLDSETSAPAAPRDAVALSMDSEIRAALAKMTKEQRTKALGQAFEVKDLSVIGAALRGPAMLTGSTPEELEMTRARYRREFHPKFHAHKERMTKAVERTKQLGNVYLSLVQEAAGLSPTLDKALAAREQRDALQTATEDE